MFISPNILAFPTGAPSEHTGAPGEKNCTSCHFGSLNETKPELTLTGLENSIKPGSQLIITLRLSHKKMKVGGIQLSIRSVNDKNLSPGDMYSSQLVSSYTKGIVYLNHQYPLQNYLDTLKITIHWKVPENEDIVLLNVAMVAGDNDLSPFGDSVVLLQRKIKINHD